MERAQMKNFDIAARRRGTKGVLCGSGGDGSGGRDELSPWPWVVPVSGRRWFSRR